MNLKIKKLSLLLALGVIVGTLVVRHRTPKPDVLHFVEDDIFDPSAKNFGAFPPDLPDRLFDNYSV